MTRSKLLFTAFLFLTLQVYCQDQSSNDGGNTIERNIGDKSLTVIREDGQLNITVVSGGSKIFNDVITPENLVEKAGANFINIDLLFDVFKNP